jgi:hypothetical protein
MPTVRFASRTDDGGFANDPAELFRVFEPQRRAEASAETGRNGVDAGGRCRNWLKTRNPKFVRT